MKFIEETVKKIVQNAEVAQEVWMEFAHDKKLRECFHLRPISDGISVISLLPYAPMRGKTVTPDKLKDELEKLAGETNRLLGIDVDKALDIMEKHDFIDDKYKKRAGRFNEYNAQALFIRGMILKHDMYEGIDFVASELSLASKSSRFDIVGYKDDNLYIFEMKKNRDQKGFKQVAEYATTINNYKEIFLKVLRKSPHCPVSNFKKVHAIAVMRYATNSVTQVENSAKEVGVDLWLYERSITLRKTAL